MIERLPPGTRRVVRTRDTHDVDEELDFHFERKIEELVANGWSAEAARIEAQRQFGDRGQYGRELKSIGLSMKRHRYIMERLQLLASAVRVVLRTLIRTPVFTLGVAIAFGLGIGANAMMYGIVSRLLLRAPDHISDPARVHRISVSEYSADVGTRVRNPLLSYPDFEDLMSAEGSSSVAGYAPADITAGRGMQATEVHAVAVTGNFFDVLGVGPEVGIFFGPKEDRAGGDQVAILGHEFWMENYGGARDVVGRAVVLGSSSYTIIGVAPAGFTGVDLQRVDLWLPFQVYTTHVYGTSWQPSRDWLQLSAVLRLKGGTVADASARATGRYVAARPAGLSTKPRIEVDPVIAGRGAEPRAEVLISKLLLAVAAAVLLIACLNIGNLLIARSIRRQHDTTIRLALGSSRWRLLGSIFIEGLILSIMGGSIAVVLSLWGGRIIRRVMLPDVLWDDRGIRSQIGPVIAMSLASAILTTIVPTLFAWRQAGRVAPRPTARSNYDPRASALRNSLMFTQAALSAVLLVGTGLFVRSFQNVERVNLGFNPAGVYVGAAIAGGPDWSEDAQQKLFSRGLDEIGRIPGVRAVAATSTFPFLSHRSISLRVPGVDTARYRGVNRPYAYEVSPGYFDAMGIHLLRGRLFNDADRRGSQPVTLISNTMAESFWPGLDPIGRCFYINTANPSAPCSTVVGVVADVHRHSVTDEFGMQYYSPVDQNLMGMGPSMFVIKLSSDNEQTLSSIRRRLLALDPRVRYPRVQSVTHLLDPMKRSWTLGATLFSIFGGLALAVAMSGMYALMAFDLTQRRRDLAIRASLGATPASLFGLILSKGIRIALGGSLFGVALSLMAAARVAPLLYGVSPRDPAVIALVVATSCVVALFTCFVPAWRARGMQITALRES